MTHMRKKLFIVLMFSILLGSFTVNAQATNLLSNPGFEGSFTSYDGEQPRQVANSWIPWHVPHTDSMPSFQNIAPKYQAVSPDTSRIRTGSNAQLYFSFFETHEGGIYQRVSGITSGTELRFSIYAYIWSSTFEVTDKSEDPGDVAVRVGIDPTGGTDGTSGNIVWSTPAIFYDAYRNYSVIATAQSTTITVFVESTVGVPVQNSYIYLDDALLEVTTAVPAGNPTSTATAIPSATTIPTTDGGIGNSTPTLEVINTNTPAPATATGVPSNTPVAPTPTQQTNTVPTATPVPGSNIGGKPITDTFPGTIVHTVRRGDTVSRIATLYGSATEAIIEANGLDSTALIYVGQGLLVPVRLSNPATVTPTSTPVVLVVTATPGAASAPTASVPATGGGGTYVVQRGDTLGAIATRFNTTVGALVQLNGIANQNRIFAGQTIRIPVATGGPIITPTSPPNVIPTPTPVPAQVKTYVVQPGDTLYRLALNFGVNIVTLAQVNNINNYNLIYIGQVLRIP